VRVLHLTDRLTDRGGSHRHLLAVVEALREQGHQVFLAAGADEGRVDPGCPVRIVAGLDARTHAPPALDGLAAAIAPDLIHVHTVVNPAVLEWVAGRPSRGKWKRDGSVCGVPMAPEACAACFEDEGYFREMHALTSERLAALRRLRIVVLSAYMKRELVAAGVGAERVTVVPPFERARRSRPGGSPASTCPCSSSARVRCARSSRRPGPRSWGGSGASGSPRSTGGPARC